MSARVVERRLSKPPAADDHATTARIGAAPTHSLRTRIRRGAARRWRDHPLQTASGCPQRLRPRCPAIPAGPPRAGSRNTAAYELYQEPNERQRQTQRPPRTSLYAIRCTASWRVPIPARATVMMTSGGSASIHVMVGNCLKQKLKGEHVSGRRTNEDGWQHTDRWLVELVGARSVGRRTVAQRWPNAVGKKDAHDVLVCLTSFGVLQFWAFPRNNGMLCASVCTCVYFAQFSSSAHCGPNRARSPLAHRRDCKPLWRTRW